MGKVETMPYSSYSDKTQSHKTRHQNGGRKQSRWLELRGLSPGTKAKQKASSHNKKTDRSDGPLVTKPQLDTELNLP